VAPAIQPLIQNDGIPPKFRVLQIQNGTNGKRPVADFATSLFPKCLNANKREIT
jgi:hypothetical protein